MANSEILADELIPAVRPPWQDPHTLRTLATILLVVALSFWLLDRLTVVLRPLLLAVLMAYVLLPYHNRLRKLVPSVVSVILIASCVAIFVGVIGFGVYASMGELQNDLPKLQKQALAMTDGASRWIAENAPWVKNALPERRSPADGRTDERVQRAIQAAIGTAAGVILEGLTAGLYLLFLLLGAGQLHDRVHGAYDSERAEKILAVFGRINSAIISYLRAKVVASLLLAFAAGVILAACGIRFALLWAVVTFLCNFIPYVGTVVAYS
ncbi:MAG TPA: AI-2E family transporter, partial [Fimbriiglobus sp.]